MDSNAVGGEVADLLATGEAPFQYSVQLQRTRDVPAPAALGLLVVGLGGLMLRHAGRSPNRSGL